MFGWTADEDESFATLDAYVAAGGNFIDTADSYSVWVDGHTGGESETVIGRWMAARGNRDDLVIATKVGQLTGGLSRTSIHGAVDASLKRLQTDRVDIYYAHIDDQETPLEETLEAFDELVRGGKVLHVAASNYSAGRFAEALKISARNGLARYEALQLRYNLVERSVLTDEHREVCERDGIACFPFSALARGLLTGKYRPGVEARSKRGRFAWTGEIDEQTVVLLSELESVAQAHDTTMTAVSLAWLCAQPEITAPIASARTPEQLADLLPVFELKLTGAEVQRLGELGALADTD